MVHAQGEHFYEDGEGQNRGFAVMMSPDSGIGASKSVLDLAETFRHADDLEACWTAFLEAGRASGFAEGFYGYLVQRRQDASGRDFVSLSSYPTAWVERYAARDYVRLDPVAHHCFRSENPATWQQTFDAASGHPDVAAYIDEARDFGLRNGLAIPLRGDAGKGGVGGAGLWARDLTLAELDKSVRRHGDELRWMTWLFHAAVIDKGLLAAHFDLSPREIEALKWAAAGLVTKEIAHRLSIAYKTADHHLSSAISKLQARNRTHAVAKALVLGIIEL